MIKITIETPTKCYIENMKEIFSELTYLTKELSYIDTSVVFNLQKLNKNKWLKENRPYIYEQRKKELEEKKSFCMMKFDEKLQKPYFHPGILYYLSDKFKFDISNNINYPTPKKTPWKKPLPFDLYPYQKSSVEELINVKHGCVELCTGCHVRGQKILMFDGTLKEVENIVVGDLLMGPDSKPRKVLKLHSGKEKMAKIIPIKGDSFVVNMGHILSLQRTNNQSQYRTKGIKRRKDFKGTNPVVNISVREYLKQTKSFKHRYKLYRTGIDFKNNLTAIDPYILGLWLGDGNSDTSALTTMDEELKNIWIKYSSQLGLNTREEIISEKNLAKTYYTYNPSKGKGLNTFKNNLKHYNLIKNKHIPEDFKINSEQNRLNILAGLIDSDGYLGKGYYEISQKNKKLSDDILFVARSLGFAAYQKEEKKKSQNGTEGIYYRITISGDVSKIPVKLERKKAAPRKQIKDVLRTGFKVEELPEDEYFGFEVDNDNLYVMDDFTVTHNSGKTAIILSIARELGLNTVIVTPSKSIFLEILEKFKHHFGTGLVGGFGNGKKQIGKRFTVCISKSLTALKPGSKEYEFFQNSQVVIGDESHTLAAETLESVFHGVLKNVPYRFFLSGTQVRGDGKDKLLESIIGKKVFKLTTKEAIDGKYICPVKFFVFEVLSKSSSKSTDPLEAKRNHFLYNEQIALNIAKLANSSWELKQESTLILVDELKQIKMLTELLKVKYDYVHSASKADAEKFGLQTRKVDEAVEAFNKGDIKVLIGTSCIATGTNIYPTHNTCNWVGGSSEIKTKQGAVGRSVRVLEKSKYVDFHKPKPFSKIFDFRVSTNSDSSTIKKSVNLLEGQFQKRLKMYRESLNKKDEIIFIKVNNE